MRPRSGRWPRCQLKMVLTHRRTVLTVDFKLSSDWNKLKKKKSFSNKTKKQNNRLVLFLTKPKHFVIIFFFLYFVCWSSNFHSIKGSGWHTSSVLVNHPISPILFQGFREDIKASDPVVLQKLTLMFSRMTTECTASSLVWFCLRLLGLPPTFWKIPLGEDRYLQMLFSTKKDDRFVEVVVKGMMSPLCGWG